VLAPQLRELGVEVRTAFIVRGLERLVDDAKVGTSDHDPGRLPPLRRMVVHYCVLFAWRWTPKFSNAQVLRMLHGLTAVPVIDNDSAMLRRFAGWAEKRWPTLREDDMVVAAMVQLATETGKRSFLRREGLHDSVAGLVEPAKTVELATDEPWAVDMASSIATRSSDEQTAWSDLVKHCERCGGRPSQKWKRIAAELTADLGHERVESDVCRWLTLAAQPHRTPLGSDVKRPGPDGRKLSDRSVAFLRGMCWLLSGPTHEGVPRVLGQLAHTSHRQDSPLLSLIHI